GGGTVTSVIDASSFALDDGRQVRLIAFDTPAQPAPGESGARAAAAVAAKAALGDLLLGQTGRLRAGASRPERDWRLVADAVVVREGAEQSVLEAMLANGHGRLGLGLPERSCMASLLASERSARRSQLGLWADSDYDLRRAEDTAAILA